MKRRFFYRRQKALLIAAIRFGYGGTIAILWLIHAGLPDSILYRLLAVGAVESSVVVFSLLFASVFLVVDAVLDFLWPLLVSPSMERICGKSRLCQTVLHQSQTVLARACLVANRWRHWFYLPPAFAALFVVPVAVWHGVGSVPANQGLYLWLCLCGVGCALIEGAINNERGKYENGL